MAVNCTDIIDPSNKDTCLQAVDGITTTRATFNASKPLIFDLGIFGAILALIFGIIFGIVVFARGVLKRSFKVH